ncbi:MAG: glycosyltransferase [Acidobacteriia bacterium]|nr:glycosyltransferase [Terriglobia bacterium]
MKVLFLVHTPVDSEPVVFSLGRALTQLGDQVLCVGYSNNGLAPKSLPQQGFEIVRVLRGNWGFLPRPLRGAVRLSRYWCSAAALARDYDPDAVVSFGYDVLPLAHRLSSPACAHVYYCTEYSPTPTLRDYYTGFGVLKRFEKHFILEMDYVVSVEPNRAAVQAREWKRNVDCVILNAPLFNDALDRHARACLSGGGPLRLVYAGGVAPRNCLPQLFQAIATRPTVTLDIYGWIQPSYRKEFLKLLDQWTRASGNRIALHPQVAYQDLPHTLAAYDAGVCLYDAAHPNTAWASPAKLFEYMRSGLAVLTTDQPTPKQVVERSDAGVVIPAADLRLIEQALDELTSQPQRLLGMRRNALKFFRSDYCYQRQSAPLLEWMHSLQRERLKVTAGYARS